MLMNIKLNRKKGIRNISLRVLPGGEVKVIAPHRLPAFVIQEFINANQDWLKEKVARMSTLPPPKAKSQTKLEYLEHKQAALELATTRLPHFNTTYNLAYKKITIRNQSSRWGSCSHSGTLSFNYRIALLDPELADYVIVHELCHLAHMNHGPKFWQAVSRAIPDHKSLRKRLRHIDINSL
jgi:predicted metal-dependent hydrolase